MEEARAARSKARAEEAEEEVIRPANNYSNSELWREFIHNLEKEEQFNPNSPLNSIPNVAPTNVGYAAANEGNKNDEQVNIPVGGAKRRKSRIKPNRKT